jgi:hypothetical protein
VQWRWDYCCGGSLPVLGPHMGRGGQAPGGARPRSRRRLTVSAGPASAGHPAFRADGSTDRSPVPSCLSAVNNRLRTLLSNLFGAYLSLAARHEALPLFARRHQEMASCTPARCCCQSSVGARRQPSWRIADVIPADVALGEPGAERRIGVRATAHPAGAPDAPISRICVLAGGWGCCRLLIAGCAVTRECPKPSGLWPDGVLLPSC